MFRKSISVIRPCLRQVNSKSTTWPAKRLLTSQPNNKPELKTTECQSNSLIQLIQDDLDKISTNRDHNSKRAHHFTIVYKGSDRETRFSLLRHLSARSVDLKVIETAARSYLEKSAHNEAYSIQSTEKMRQALTAPYITLFKKIGRLEYGVKFLVDLRADILELMNNEMKSESASDVEIRRLKAMSDQLRNLLSMWFSVGLLNLERVTWNSPCYLLQKVSEYEAVHPLRNWTDLKRRVGAFRRCYVFTHSCLPTEPLVILHIALTKEISSNIADIVKSPAAMQQAAEANELDDNQNLLLSHNETNAGEVNAAIFYSISSPQRGLHGIELGTQMIRTVGTKIRSDFPNINKFSSLSPIPDFRDYLLSEIQSVARGDAETVTNFIKDDEMKELANCLLSKSALYNTSKNLIGNNDKNMWRILAGEIRSNRWFNDEQLVRLLRAPLMRKCAHYLYEEKRRAYALNAVAHFHLRNGAVMWRLNWVADVSPRGLSNSCGIMINYRYYIDDMDKLAEDYVEQKVIHASDNFLQFVHSI